MTRIAIIHDWLTVFSGAERVLEQMLLMYPQADLYTVCDFLSDEDRKFLRGRRVRKTYVQHLPAARKHYRAYLPLMPSAISRLDLSDYDLILSSSHAVAKGVATTAEQLHISYVHTPMRYVWDLQQQYLRQSGLDKGLKSWVVRMVLSRLRSWDATTADRVNYLVANSRFIAQRIKHAYGRESTVIYPPVDIEYFSPHGEKQNFYLAASRMVPYKRLDIIIQAFSRMPDRKLVVIGNGPDFPKLSKNLASNVTLMGRQSREMLREKMRAARAFLFAAEEDFGIIPVEAQACGTPVIAFRRGGAVETVRGLEQERPTGVFFDCQSTEAVISAVEGFERQSGTIRAEDCRSNAEDFSIARFRNEFMLFVEDKWNESHSS